MLVRGFEALSLAVNGGSAFTKNGRPSSSTTLAIWPLAPRAKKVAQRTSVARRSPAVIAVRFFISLPWERQQQFWSLLLSGQFSTLPRSGQCPFSTRAAAERSTLGEIAWRWLILRSRAGGDADPATVA